MNLTLSLHPGWSKVSDKARIADAMKASSLETFQLPVGADGLVPLDDIYPGMPDLLNWFSEQGLWSEAATVPLSVDQLLSNPDYLKLAQVSGIKTLTLWEVEKRGYFVRSRLTKLRAALENLAPILQEHQVRLILPVLGGTLLPSPSAAFYLVRGLNPWQFGVQLDPGGKLFEGFESWDYTVAILGDYLASILIRDSEFVKDPAAPKGWSRRWADPSGGTTDWGEMFVHLRAIEWTGSLLFAPMGDGQFARLPSWVDYICAFQRD